MPYTQCSEINSFEWLDDVSTNKVEYQSLTHNQGFGISFSPANYRMVRTETVDNSFTIALLCDEDKRVLYYIKCEIWSDVVLKAKPVTQVKLWRTSNSKYQTITSGLPAKIFNMLLTEFNVVASDGVHTYSGRRFWQQELSRAINNGLFVYRYDLMKSELQPIIEADQVTSKSMDLWGSDEKYMTILAVISKESLDIKL